MILQKPKFLRSHPSVTIKPTAPAPRFESSRCFLHGALRERNANCPHHLKVANPARLVPLPPIEGVRLAAGGAGAKSEILFARSPSGVQGVPPDTPLVTFVVKRKSPGCRAWQSHALAERPHIVGRRGPRPCKAPEGDRSPPSTYTPKRTKSCIPTCNSGKEKNKKRKPPCFSAGPVLYSI